MTRTVDETAFARISRAARSTVEPLEDRRLMAGDSTFVSALPFQLEFDAPRGGLADKDGKGTGFTWVQPNKLGNEYHPGNIDLNTAQGILYLTTTGTAAAGGPWESDNTLVNGLQTQFNASTGGVHDHHAPLGPARLHRHSPASRAASSSAPTRTTTSSSSPSRSPAARSSSSSTSRRPATTFAHSLSSSASLVEHRQLRQHQHARPRARRRRRHRQDPGVLPRQRRRAAPSSRRSSRSPARRRPAFFSAAGRAGLIAMHKNDAGPDHGRLRPLRDRRRHAADQPPERHRQPPRRRRAPASAATSSSPPTSACPTPATASTPPRSPAPPSSSTARATARSSTATVNTTGGGDAIVLQPKRPLDANTSYTFEITDGVKDTGGSAFVPFTMTFTTGTASTPADPRIAFEKVAARRRHRASQYTGLTIGPDGKLYAATHRRASSTASRSTPTARSARRRSSTPSRPHNGGKRFVTGIAFDPVQHREQPDPVGQPRPVRARRTRPTGPARSAG